MHFAAVTWRFLSCDMQARTLHACGHALPLISEALQTVLSATADITGHMSIESQPTSFCCGLQISLAMWGLTSWRSRRAPSCACGPWT